MRTGLIDSGFYYTLNWSTMTNKRHHDTNRRYFNQACTLVKSTNESILVAMTSGTDEYGLDLVDVKPSGSFNSWSKISDKLPEEIGKSNGLAFSQLLSVNNGNELLLYGGQIGNQIFDGIYKFYFASKTWLQVGKMKFPRSAHVVIPVHDLSCPKND